MTSHIKHSGLESRSTVRLEGHHRSDGHRRTSINDVAFSCDGNYIGSAASDQTLRIWDVYQISNSTTRAFSSSKELAKHTGAVNKIAWDPVNPKILASASTDKTARIWDLRSKKTDVLEIKTRAENYIIAFSPDGKHICVRDKNDTLHFIDPRSGDNQGQIKVVENVKDMKWSPAGDSFLIATSDGNVSVNSWPSLKLQRKIQAHQSGCTCIDIDKRSSRFAIGGADAIVTLWDVDEYYCIRSLESCEFPVRCTAFSHDGLLLASGYNGVDESFIDIAGTDTGKLVHKLQVGLAFNSLAWHPSKMLLAYCGEDFNEEPTLSVFGF